MNIQNTQEEHNYKILCIDDNKNNLFTLNALLSTINNLKCIEAISARDALDILLKQHIDLILCDVQMPDMNGFELARMLKSNKRTKDIPIVFLTAIFKSEEFVNEGFTIGAVDYLTKPIDDKQLLNKIKLYLKVFEERRKSQESEKLLYNIAQSIGEGIYTIDTNTQTTFINIEAIRMLGYNEQELLGKNIYSLIHEKQNKELYTQLLAGTQYIEENTYLKSKNGILIPVSIVATPLYTDNKIVGGIIIFKDKSETQKIAYLEQEKLTNQEQIIHSMIDMIESRDSYTAGHTRRVAEYSVLIAKKMGYSMKEIELLKNAAWLHDIGKISTPDSVLLKPGYLNSTEYSLIQDHLNAGYEMLRKIDQYQEIANIMREHHEKYDGSGYPRGLKAEEIHPLSRIMIVADAFDAMTTNRVYKPRKTIDVALEELQVLSGKHFHPEIVDAALQALQDIVVNEDISQLPQTSIEEQRFAYFYKDRLTNLFIIDYLSLLVRYHIDSKSAYMYDIKLHHFSKYNADNSWSMGDTFLIEFASFLDRLYENVVVFRVEGDDFMILSEYHLEHIDIKLGECALFYETIVTYSVEQRYIEDISTLLSC